MLNQLMEFGRRIRNQDVHDALEEEFVSVDIYIDAEGRFVQFNSHDKLPTVAEALTSKKGKARLLLDKAEEILGFEPKKHALFLEKLEQYRTVPSLQPVLRFYEENRGQGLDKAVEAFTDIPEKIRKENFAFCLMDDSRRVHEHEDVKSAVIATHEAKQQANTNPEGVLCSICGSADSPIGDQAHGMIKRVPAGQSTGCALVSFNANAFESYGLRGNENASICAACARNYREGLNYLLGNGVQCTPEKGKPYFQYSNRKKLSADTAMIFWTRNQSSVPELDYVDDTSERLPDIAAMIMGMPATAAPPRDDALLSLLSSPFSGNNASLESVNVDVFYSCALSGAAARIAVRDWIEIATPTMRHNLAEWFHGIAILENDYTTQLPAIRFFALRELAAACAVHRKKDVGGKTQYAVDPDDDFIGRAAIMLWRCALKRLNPPRTLLDRILRRIRLEEGRVTAPRAALLKFILNHDSAQTGGHRMQPQLDTENTDTAYTAGRVFAMLESIQTAALGNELNAPIRDRFFSAASTNPAAAFGRLLKLSQAHFGKLRGEKPGLAVKLDKKMGELICRITNFPVTFSLEEQGRFAIGYYHQRQDNFTAKNTPEE